MLTDAQIRNLKPMEKAKKYADGGGLYLYVAPTGSKLWRMGYRFNDKEKLLSFGKYPLVSLKEARAKRDAAKKLIMDGIDPSRQKQEAKREAILADANTFERIAQEWHETQNIHNSDKDRTRKLATLQKHVFPAFKNQPISQITAQDMLMILKPLEQDGQELLAHRIRQYCQMIFRYAIATGRIAHNVVNDLKGAIRAHKGRHRPTILSPEKIGELMLKLENYNGYFQVKNALRLYPLLFVRSAELSQAEWNEFNFETSEWHIPAERMKMRLPHIVPLSTQAVGIFRELRSYTGKSRYVFPSRNSIKKPIHPATPLQALRSLGYDKEELCIHGFRSMASTLLNEKGFEPDWIERQLAHKERNNSRIAYNHAQYLPQRHEMMQAWADYLTSLLEKARADANKPKPNAEAIVQIVA